MQKLLDGKCLLCNGSTRYDMHLAIVRFYLRLQMVEINEIESLGFTYLGSRWFKNADDTIRIRQWKDFSVDIWNWKDIEEECMIVFRGRLMNQLDFKWVLNRIN